MEAINLSTLTSGYRERMRRLALLDSLAELERKRETDQQGHAIDMRGLGMLTLLFFFERRLTREYKTGTRHVIIFLRSAIKDKYILEEEKIAKIARTIMTTFRPTSGMKRKFSFFNWETRTKETIEYTILKDNDFDVKTNTQYYTLDEDGLELLFATKEFYSEFQISINQLLLRQQVNKGEFSGALRQIREMEIDVDTLKERMENMKLEILRSIVSEETFERYKNLLEDTHLRLEREDDEFKALTTFVEETRDTLYTGDTKSQEQKSYELLVRIVNELEAVHYAHTRLLELTSDLRNTALSTAQESLYYTGIQSFNFDMDIVSTILSKPLPLDAVKGVLHPFLKVEENRFWSPLTILAEQNITEENPERSDGSFIEVAEQNSDQTYRAWIANKYYYIMKQFIKAYEQGSGQTLKQFMDYLEEVDSSLLSKRYFYSFWLLLHQRSPTFAGQVDDRDEQTILGDSLSLLGSRRLEIKETADILTYHKRYSIQNMVLTLEGVVE